MNSLRHLQLAVSAAALLLCGAVSAQDERDDATDVWIAVEAQWDAVEKGDDTWIDERLMDEFYGWRKNSPAPRSKASTRKWDRFNATQGKSVAHELYPLEIVIHEDTAIVHYLYTTAFEEKDGEVKVNRGRFTDILVRTDDGWRFLGWHGGHDD